MKTLIIGCGYVGLPLALRCLKRGHDVDVWVRSATSAVALADRGFGRIIAGSVAEELLWQAQEKYDEVIHCASSGGGGAEAYREVFFEGARLMSRHQPQARRLFISSTSVYGQTDGQIVTEEAAANPKPETGKILREAEELVLAAGGIVVRPSGIYGPGRTVLLEKLRQGEAVIESGGTRWLNQIHRDDLVEALGVVTGKGTAGNIYNATDDEPVMQRDYYAWCADFLGKPLPPEGPANPNRKRGLTSKRVSNAKLRGLGWKPSFPNFREGILNMARE